MPQAIDPNPGNLWNSPATLVQIAVGLFTVLSAIAAFVTLVRSIKQARAARKSADEAKASAERAEKLASDANMARADIAEQLKASNLIATEARRVAEAHLEIEKKRREIALEIGNRVAGRDGDIHLFVTIRNKSAERRLTIHRFFAYSKTIPSKTFPVWYGLTSTGNYTIVPDTLSEFELRVFKVAEAVPLQLASRHQWKLAVEFQGDANFHPLESNHVEAFVAACCDLREWMDAHPEKSHPGKDTGWTLTGFQHTIRL